VKGEAEYFCEGGLDDPNQIESPQQIAVYAHAISEAFKVRRAFWHPEQFADLPDETGQE
jgi:hypothetical protein